MKLQIFVENIVYFYFTDGKTERGCLKDLKADDPKLKLCKDEKDETCKICQADKCNEEKKAYHECYK